MIEPADAWEEAKPLFVSGIIWDYYDGLTSGIAVGASGNAYVVRCFVTDLDVGVRLFLCQPLPREEVGRLRALSLVSCPDRPWLNPAVHGRPPGELGPLMDSLLAALRPSMAIAAWGIEEPLVGFTESPAAIARLVFDHEPGFEMWPIEKIADVFAEGGYWRDPLDVSPEWAKEP
ncbi:MAG TPA: hypothetical protein VMI31_00155 [Fimbriimonadaceae bacterium]|nr:hypothetical protein [Fimbriimonadaceae bacterium]